MVYVFIVLALICGLAAWRTKERSTRIWFAIWAVLNAAGAAKAIITDDPWAFRLKPNDGYSEPDYRPDRR